jgi:HEAT repeat protein
MALSLGVVSGLVFTLAMSGCNGNEEDALALADLESGNPVVRNCAIQAVGARGLKAAIPRLRTFLSEESPSEARLMSLHALGQLGATNCVEDIIRVFESSEGSLKDAAIETLGKLRDPRAVPVLVAEIQGTNVSLVALWALGSIGDTDAIPPLSDLLSADDTYVRYNARRALERIGN